MGDEKGGLGKVVKYLEECLEKQVEREKPCLRASCLASRRMRPTLNLRTATSYLRLKAGQLL